MATTSTKKTSSAGKSGKTNAKKSTSKKTASKKSGSNKKSKSKAKQLTIEDLINRRELASTLVFVLGVLLLILLMAGTEDSVWNKIHTFYLAVSGTAGYYLPFAVLFVGIVNVLNVQKPVYRHKLFEIFILFLLINALLHINNYSSFHSDLSFLQSVKNVYYDIMTYKTPAYSTGGVSGAVVGGAFFQLTKSRFVANTIAVVLIITDLMFMFGITLFKLLSGLEKPARKVGEYTEDAIDNVKSDYERIKSEHAQMRELKKQAATVNPSRIVDDFYKNNPEASSEVKNEKQKTGKRTEKNTEKNKTPVFSSEIASIFDTVNEKSEKADTLPAANENKSADKGNIFTFTRQKNKPKIDIATDDSCKGEVLVESKPDNKVVKVDPLTSEERKSLESELDVGLESKSAVEYVKPSLELLNKPTNDGNKIDTNELKNNGEKLIEALNSFGVNATIVDVVPGPSVTRYELSPARGVKISKFVGLSDDLALHMAAPAGLRIEAPIPNKAAIGIEIPNKNKITVTFRETIDNDKFRNAKSKLNVALGKDIAGDVIFCDIAKMPHLLVAGTTGSGKSVCLNTMIMSILYNASPDEVKLILIDPKEVEFGVYNGIPHLLVPVVSDPRKASGALGWAVTEMLSRYKTLNANGVRDIGAYNSLCETRDDLVKMSQVVIVIDELADLMTVAPAEVEDSIQRLAQMARAAGMHLVVATQRPSVDVITGIIKANIPSRIALTVKSQIDSRTIIDSAGAEKLLGNGDMLYYPVGVPKPIRVQGAYISDEERSKVIDAIKLNGTAAYDDVVQKEIERQAPQEKKKGASLDGDSDNSKVDKNDDLVARAVELFVSAPEKASISALQRHLSLGFAKAGRVMDMLEEKGFVGPTEGSKPRKVLITKAQWYEMNAMSSQMSEPEINSDSSDDFEEISSETDG